jgi:hypothetical protein
MIGAGAETFRARVGPSVGRTAGARTLLTDLERTACEGSDKFLAGIAGFAGAVATVGVAVELRPLRRKAS